MNKIIIFICKLIQVILKKMGRGTSLPGQIARTLNKDILKSFEKPKTLICVTGTTGKTSISTMLYSIYENAGYKVAYNSKGSNLEDGVISAFIEASSFTGKMKKEVLVIEVDERYVKKVFTKVKPDYFVINNISRDQMARNGHFDVVWKEINNSITKDIHLILNADDPLIYKFSLDHKGKVSYYGLAKTKMSKKKINGTLDLNYCPKCSSKINYDYIHYGSSGKYYCEKNDFKRPDVEFESKYVDESHFKINGDLISMPNTAIYNIYNMSACYVTAYATGVEKEKISAALNNLSLKVKRLDTFKIGKKEGVILLSKNETPISYNQSLEYVEKQKEDKTVIIGFDRVSGRYDLKDLSWLYDINFELLNDESVKRIICVGTFANDIAVRLKYAQIDQKKIMVFTSSDNIIDIIKEKTKGKVYCVLYFDIFYRLKDLLHKGVK